MSTTAMSDRPRTRATRQSETRKPDYVVRAKSGPGNKDYSTIGFAWNRDDGGFSVKLHSIPIGDHWNGVLKVLPPLQAEGESEMPNDE